MLIPKQMRRQLVYEILESRRLLHGQGIEITPTHIISGHDGHDVVPRFAANAEFVAVKDGAWSDPLVWNKQILPGAGAKIQIPHGIELTYDLNSQMELDAIEVGGWLDFAPHLNTSLWLNEIIVLPDGGLTIGTEANPIHASVTAEIVFTDTPGPNGLHFKTGTLEHPGIDPEQWGNGLIAYGTVTMFGHEKTSTYVRLLQEPLAGDQVLVVEEAPIGWQAGDELILPDTSATWQRIKTERLVVDSVEGNRIKLVDPLAYDHRGPRIAIGAQPEYLPHIGNLTRNIIVRSENPSGVRGHVAFLARADVDIRYASFESMGRTTNGALDGTQLEVHGLGHADEHRQVTHIGTNQAGRYALHFHHLLGPHNPEDVGYQFHLVGNAIQQSLKWAVTVHGSHYGLIKNNFVFDYQGAGFVTENGTEAFNRFEGNFAVLSNSNSNDFKGGRAGEGFWFRGPLTSVVNNVSANSQRAGFVYFVQNLHGVNQTVWPKPAFRGADLTLESESVLYNVFRTPVLQFEGNEVYASEAVFDNWLSIPREKQYLIDLAGWNINRRVFAVSSYSNENLVIDGLKLTGDLTTLNPNSRQGYQPIARIGIDAVRQSDSINVRNSQIQGVQVGFETPAFGPEAWVSNVHEMVIEDSIFQAFVGVAVRTMTATQNVGREGDYARLIIKNSRFLRMPENNIEPEQYAIHMQFGMRTDVTKKNEVFVYDFNGVPGANYRIYYPEQAPNFIVPQTVEKSVIGATEAGLTNAETWAKYGIAIGGAVAPSREIDGDNGEAALARGRALGIHGLVFPLEAQSNQAPTVNAGGPLSTEQYRQVLLPGQVSDDGRATGAGGGAAHVDWSKRSGPGEVFFATGSAEETFATFTEPGNYIVRLTASDGLLESFDEFQVKVNAANNRAPKVNAGADLILESGNTTSLNGIVTDDGKPNQLLQTTWSVVTGPGGVKFDDPTKTETTVTFLAKGQYVLELSATDGEFSSADFISVTVNVALPVSPLLVHLEMKDGQATDSSLHGLDGIAVGTTIREGKFGAALNFSGNSHVDLPRTEFLQPTAGLTAAVWVRPAVVDGVMRPILVWDGGSWDGYRIEIANSATGARLSAGVATVGNQLINVSTAPFTDTEWTHLALTYTSENGGEVRLYRNSQLLGSRLGVGTRLTYAPHADRRLTLGKENPTSSGPAFIGGMDDVRIYNYALSPAELNSLIVGPTPAGVVNRMAFYNNSAFDGNSPQANAADDQAIAWDKLALLTGTATAANYTNYSRGINGIMIDIAGSLPQLSASDFTFRVGNSNDPSSWAAVPIPTQIVVRNGAGTNGTSRVTLIWPDNAIERTWLQVTVLANSNTGLAKPDVFYFGNAIGDTGNSPLDAIVNGTDVAAVANQQTSFLTPAAISNPHDLNRDRQVNATDILIASLNQTSFLNSLRMISLGGQSVVAVPFNTTGAFGGTSELLVKTEANLTVALDEGTLIASSPNFESSWSYLLTFDIPPIMLHDEMEAYLQNVPVPGDTRESATDEFVEELFSQLEEDALATQMAMQFWKV